MPTLYDAFRTATLESSTPIGRLFADLQDSLLAIKSDVKALSDKYGTDGCVSVFVRLETDKDSEIIRFTFNDNKQLIVVPHGTVFNIKETLDGEPLNRDLMSHKRVVAHILEKLRSEFSLERQALLAAMYEAEEDNSPGV